VAFYFKVNEKIFCSQNRQLYIYKFPSNFKINEIDPGNRKLLGGRVGRNNLLQLFQPFTLLSITTEKEILMKTLKNGTE